MTQAETAVRILVTEARPLILNTHRRDSCIYSTAIAVDVLRYAGVMAKPVEVGAMAVNAAAAPHIGTPVADWPPGAWSVGCLPGQPAAIENRLLHRPHSWPGGHLVAHARHPDLGELLIDLSADQMDRPHRNLRVPGPIVATWDHDPTGVELDDGTQVAYKRVPPTTPSFRQSPDWKDRARRRDIVRHLIRLIEQETDQ